jgi:spermidine synthase
MAAGFLFLRYYTVSTTLQIAIVANVLVGVTSIALQKRARRWMVGKGKEASAADHGLEKRLRKIAKEEASGSLLPHRLILFGIAVSGFCALGYEVLWTRILSMVVVATVYGFTIMLVAFLTGIALGSKAFGLFHKAIPESWKGPERSVVYFGGVQIIIGLAALTVTYYLRDLPAHAIRIQNYLLGTGISEFEVRQGANFAVAFSHMFIPAFFMGIAFPLAGNIHANRMKSVGEGVGEVLAYNTMGAILGSALSGFVLIYTFGIERSLQFLTIINIGAGILIAASMRRNRAVNWGIAAATAFGIVLLATHPDGWRMWDKKYFAIYRSNQREAFSSSFTMRDAMENTDVLYYAEGVEATVSSIKVKGGHQAFITNGRVEASDRREDRQCQYTLGHLPMLLNRAPKRVFVLGTGSGMTLGAVSIHPGVEEITLAEIEPKVLGVARSFAAYNHKVLDNPKLKIVFNDGRNFLMTTMEKFDVITADPIHPWFSGAGYLYTTEYFRLAASRLRHGGIACQWLPIYELTVDDLKSVVRTFTENFKYSMLWLTRTDAELVGSNDPIVIDVDTLGKRIAAPGVADDLESVDMGSAEDLLSYFVMGTEGLKAFAKRGIVNTDDNLHLEFSAPLSVGVPLMGENARSLYRFRESLLPYLLRDENKAARNEQERKWIRFLQAGRMYAAAHVLFLSGHADTPNFQEILSGLDRTQPGYAPLRFLKSELEELDAMNPTLVRAESFALLDPSGAKVLVELSAVMARVGEQRAAVIFVDNRARVIYGQIYVDASKGELEKKVRYIANEVMMNLRNNYQQEAAHAARAGSGYPPAGPSLQKMREIITSMTKVRGGS